MGALAQGTEVDVTAEGVVPMSKQIEAEVAQAASEDADMQATEVNDMATPEQAIEAVKKMTADSNSDLGGNGHMCSGSWDHERMITLAKKIDAWQKHGALQHAMDKAVYMNKPLIQECLDMLSKAGSHKSHLQYKAQSVLQKALLRINSNPLQTDGDATSASSPQPSSDQCNGKNIFGHWVMGSCMGWEQFKQNNLYEIHSTTTKFISSWLHMFHEKVPIWICKQITETFTFAFQHFIMANCQPKKMQYTQITRTKHCREISGMSTTGGSTHWNPYYQVKMNYLACQRENAVCHGEVEITGDAHEIGAITIDFKNDKAPTDKNPAQINRIFTVAMSPCFRNNTEIGKKDVNAPCCTNVNCDWYPANKAHVLFLDEQLNHRQLNAFKYKFQFNLGSQFLGSHYNQTADSGAFSCKDCNAVGNMNNWNMTVWQKPESYNTAPAMKGTVNLWKNNTACGAVLPEPTDDMANADSCNILYHGFCYDAHRTAEFMIGHLKKLKVHMHNHPLVRNIITRIVKSPELRAPLGTAEAQVQAILEEIANYKHCDCVSGELLGHWQEWQHSIIMDHCGLKCCDPHGGDKIPGFDRLV